jgi:hypothetical protein
VGWEHSLESEKEEEEKRKRKKKKRQALSFENYKVLPKCRKELKITLETFKN